MGVILWTPDLVSKGCFLNLEVGRAVVRCHTDEALARAKSLVNLQFSWYLTGTVLFVVVLYLQLNKVLLQLVLFHLSSQTKSTFLSNLASFILILAER
ncbi:hypothetical protein QYE76_007600 [Lolium multiflorum]|uniref:Uncharacterized protein n=1 Tax=Lolium multiflorum TaxID=4521 RepID=A0AAD8QGC6_LOLMU|nr:hypothetical protein QYE76_007600 [Lolium multiflorum]